MHRTLGTHQVHLPHVQTTLRSQENRKGPHRSRHRRRFGGQMFPRGMRLDRNRVPQEKTPTLLLLQTKKLDGGLRFPAIRWNKWHFWARRRRWIRDPFIAHQILIFTSLIFSSHISAKVKSDITQKPGILSARTFTRGKNLSPPSSCCRPFQKDPPWPSLHELYTRICRRPCQRRALRSHKWGLAWEWLHFKWGHTFCTTPWRQLRGPPRNLHHRGLPGSTCS